MIPIAKPDIGEEERHRVDAILRDGQLAAGDEVRTFEEAFARYCGTRQAVATSNGTTALHAAIAGLGLGPGDRVLTTPFSFIASASAPRLAGCNVGFVDIDPDTYAIDTRKLENALRDGAQVDAVIAVHLYGLPADLHHLTELAEEYEFDLIEDAAQAHGATSNGSRVGSIGDVGCFSFYPTKNMTTGEGGMVTTDREAIAERIASFIDHGRTEGYRHDTIGHNFRMTNIAAAIGRVQLERLPSFIEARRSNARRYNAALEGTPLVRPTEPPGRTHVYNQYTIRSAHRDRLQSQLDDAGIESVVYYPRPIHHQAPYAGHQVAAPVAEAVADDVLSLPVHPGVDDEAIDRVVACLREHVEAVA